MELDCYFIFFRIRTQNIESVIYLHIYYLNIYILLLILKIAKKLFRVCCLLPKYHD